MDSIYKGPVIWKGIACPDVFMATVFIAGVCYGVTARINKFYENIWHRSHDYVMISTDMIVLQKRLVVNTVDVYVKHTKMYVEHLLSVWYIISRGYTSTFYLMVISKYLFKLQTIFCDLCKCYPEKLYPYLRPRSVDISVKSSTIDNRALMKPSLFC